MTRDHYCCTRTGWRIFRHSPGCGLHRALSRPDNDLAHRTGWNVLYFRIHWLRQLKFILKANVLHIMFLDIQKKQVFFVEKIVNFFPFFDCQNLRKNLFPLKRGEYWNSPDFKIDCKLEPLTKIHLNQLLIRFKIFWVRFVTREMLHFLFQNKILKLLIPQIL